MNGVQHKQNLNISGKNFSFECPIRCATQKGVTTTLFRPSNYQPSLDVFVFRDFVRHIFLLQTFSDTLPVTPSLASTLNISFLSCQFRPTEQKKPLVKKFMKTAKYGTR